MQRLAVALAAAALVVALLGATPLGNAAEKTVKQVVRAGKSSKQARGPRGPRGPRGLRGFQGPPGVKGDKGETGGLPNAFEARNTNPIEISATTPEAATTVLTSGTLPIGKYSFTAQISLNGTGYALVSCQAQGPGSAGPRLGAPATLHVGTGADSVRAGTLPLAFAGVFPAPGPVYVGCWLDNASPPHPIAASSDVVALTIGTLGGP